MVTTCGVAVCTVITSEVADVHCCIHAIHIGEIAWTSLDGSLSVMVDVDCGIHVIVVTISLNGHAVLMLDWVAGSTILPLLAKFRLSNCLYLVVALRGVLSR